MRAGREGDRGLNSTQGRVDWDPRGQPRASVSGPVQDGAQGSAC